MFFNRIKTVLLLGALSGLLLLLGWSFGGTAGVNIALILALAMNLILYFFSDRIVLAIYKAEPLDENKYGWIYTIVAELAKTMRMPMPKLWLIHSTMANAFATGRSPKHASVAVTTGILDILDHNELRGVLAHELSHVKNRDMLVATLAATIATAIGYLANMTRHMVFWRSVGGRNKKDGNPLGLLLISIIVPIAATLIQLAISRSREYLADETGAQESQDPLALASALQKLHSHIPQAQLNPKDTVEAATAPLFIVHPFNGRGALAWFSTHPPVQERIERLEKMFEKSRR